MHSSALEAPHLKACVMCFTVSQIFQYHLLRVVYIVCLHFPSLVEEEQAYKSKF